jgi:CheY-like chemotaxis protein/HPt (histidine-containing phosphotransfer) domain-containing protein
MVLMDHMMPGMDGIEATKRIRELGGERFAKLPIIALTANAISGMRDMFLQNGFDDYLAKPIEISKLDNVIERWTPEEKRVKFIQPAAKDDAETPSIKIDGLDAARGTALTGGTERGYFKVLRLYCKDAAERLNFLREFEARMAESIPDDSSLSLFVTQTHALKSASASIGASEISRDAASLETAGKNRDMEAIASALGAFCDDLSSLALRIAKAISCQFEIKSLRSEDLKPVREQPPDDGLASEDNSDGAGSANFHDKALRRLKDALSLEDVRAADIILAELSEMPLDALMSESISRISDCVLVSDFRRAAEEVEVLLAVSASEPNVEGRVMKR